MNEILPMMYELREPVFLWGEPGVGKSMIIKQFAQETGKQLIDVRVTTMDSVDLRGLCWIDKERDQTRWYRPEFIPREEVPGIVLLDELTAAEPRLQASCYELVLDRRVGPHRLADGWWVLGAGNAPEDGAVSYAMGTALSDRFVHYYLIPTAEDWIPWAEKNGLHLAVLTFIRVKPEYLNSNGSQKRTEQLISPSPRSWHKVSRVLQQKPGQEARELTVSGIVGEAAGCTFFQVLEEVSSLIPMDQLFRMKPAVAAKKIPKTVTSLYGLAYSSVEYATDMEGMIFVAQMFEELCKVSDKLPRTEIQTLAMHMLLAKAHKSKILMSLAKHAKFAFYRKKSIELIGA